jgi:hypothetical protein
MNIQSEAERKHEEILSKYVSPRHGVLTKENALKAMRELEESLSPASPVREALEKIVNDQPLGGFDNSYHRLKNIAREALTALHSWIRSQGKEPKTSIILKKEI